MDYNLARSLSLVINEGFDIIIASADFLICELKYLVLVSNHLLVLRTLRPRVSTHKKVRRTSYRIGGTLSPSSKEIFEFRSLKFVSRLL